MYSQQERDDCNKWTPKLKSTLCDSRWLCRWWRWDLVQKRWHHCRGWRRRRRRSGRSQRGRGPAPQSCQISDCWGAVGQRDAAWEKHRDRQRMDAHQWSALRLKIVYLTVKLSTPDILEVPPWPATQKAVKPVVTFVFCHYFNAFENKCYKYLTKQA